MAKIKIVLWKYQPNADGTCPLRLRIYKDKRRMMNTGYSVRTDQWDERAEKVLNNHPNQAWLNNFLIKMKSDAMDEAIQADNKDYQATSKQIVSRIRGTNTDYFTFAESYLKKLHNPRQIGSYNGQHTSLNNLRKYVGRDRLFFNEITHTFLREYETHLKDEGKKTNTIWSNLKKIRALYYAGIREGLADDKKNPFKTFKLIKAKSKKEVLTEGELVLIRDADVQVWTGKWHAKNVFLLQFHIRGVRISDILTMEERHVINGRYCKQTQKTDDTVSVVLNDEAVRIIAAYRREKARRKIISPFLLPLVKTGDAMSLYRRVGNATAYINKELRSLAKQSGITKRISSHVARHSYAAMAKNRIGDIHTLQQLLGHSSIAVTQAYLKDLDSVEMDSANKIVTNF